MTYRQCSRDNMIILPWKKKKKKISPSIHCLELYVKLGKLSLRAGPKNILMTPTEFSSLMSTEDSSELCFILANKRNENIIRYLRQGFRGNSAYQK